MSVQGQEVKVRLVVDSALPTTLVHDFARLLRVSGNRAAAYFGVWHCTTYGAVDALRPVTGTCVPILHGPYTVILG